MTRCIYCTNDVGNHKGDHIIPSALGEFKDAKLFKSICEPCNNKLSPLEQTLLNFTGVRLFRDVVLCGKTRRGKNHSSWPQKNAGDAKAPVVEVDKAGETHPTGVSGPGETTAFENLRFEKDGSDPVTIKLYPKMNSDSLKDQVERKIGSNINWAEHNISGEIIPDNHDKYNQIFQDAFGFKIGQLQESSLESGVILHRFIFEEKSGRALRAIAKIAFHYCLTYSKRHNGFESYFDDIKKYIMDGSKNLYVRDLSPNVVKEGEENNWSHVINSFDIRKENYSGIVCIVGLFWANNSFKPLTYLVHLHWNENVLHIPNGSLNINTISAHEYVYYKKSKQTRKYKGEIHKSETSTPQMKKLIMNNIWSFWV